MRTFLNAAFFASIFTVLVGLAPATSAAVLGPAASQKPVEPGSQVIPVWGDRYNGYGRGGYGRGYYGRGYYRPKYYGGYGYGGYGRGYKYGGYGGYGYRRYGYRRYCPPRYYNGY